LEENGVEEPPEIVDETTVEETESLEVSPEGEIPEAEIEEDFVEEQVEPLDEPVDGELEIDDDFEEEIYEEEVQEEDLATCTGCDQPLPPDVTECPECGTKVEEEAGLVPSEGCPICGSVLYSIESGDLVSCDDCGNVYTKKEYAGPPKQNWKIKFWLGLIFIIVGDLVVALGSYIHNVARWSPLGEMYLGYGWMDQMVGIIGIVLFLLGLILFSWSFKRDREVECPSCKIVITEGELLPIPEEDEEEAEPEPEAIETAMEEIGDVGECPNCGEQVSIFDEMCPNCETPLEITQEVEEFEEEIIEEMPPEAEEAPLPEEPVAEGEPAEPEYVSGSELDETQMVLESLELIEEEVDEVDEDGLRALEELEAEFEISSLDEAAGSKEETTCPECGMIIENGSKNCPICGIELPGGE